MAGSDTGVHPQGVRHRPTAVLLVGLTAIVVAQFALVLMFAWSFSRAGPHELPLAISGPSGAEHALAHGLERSQPGAFEVTFVTGAPAARAAVSDRRVYAAVLLSRAGAVVYLASAASPAVAQLLAQALPVVVEHVMPGAVVTMSDLAPNPVDDPNGTALPTALIPLTMTSIAAGVVIGLFARGRRKRLVTLVGYSVLAGLLVTVALRDVIGGLGGSWIGNELVITLAAASIAAASCGLATVAGIAGILLTLLVVWFFGFAFSGATTAWQLMPTPWGHLAQYLPVGATNTGLRSVAFFDGAESTMPLVVLGAWTLAGIALTLAGRGRNRETAEASSGT